MSILIKGMEIPQTGLYFVGVDNTNGRDKTVVTVERMIGNRDVRQIVGSYELVPVPEHGRLIDGDVLFDFILNIYKNAKGDARKAYSDVLDVIVATGDVIPADRGEGEG